MRDLLVRGAGVYRSLLPLFLVKSPALGCCGDGLLRGGGWGRGGHLWFTCCGASVALWIAVGGEVQMVNVSFPMHRTLNRTVRRTCTDRSLRSNWWRRTTLDTSMTERCWSRRLGCGASLDQSVSAKSHTRQGAAADGSAIYCCLMEAAGGSEVGRFCIPKNENIGKKRLKRLLLA